MNLLKVIRFCIMFLLVFAIVGCQPEYGKINREELVRRHSVTVDSMDSLSSLTVGNGRFAFTADITGLQSFPELYEKGVSLGTQSEWGWHSFPNDSGYTFEETLVSYDFYGRKVPYSVQINEPLRNREAVNYFRQNPHRLHLGMVGLDFYHPDGSPVQSEEIGSIDQTLDPWNGQIHSRYIIDGLPVEVFTCAHQDLDLISARIVSPLIDQGLLRVKLKFPYPTGLHTDSGADWNQPEKHSSELMPASNSASIQRQLDTGSYIVRIAWQGKAKIYENEKHSFYLEPGTGQSEFSFSCLFAPVDTIPELPDFKATASNSKKAWKAFWMNGGAVDFSGSTDPRAHELERRVVLSQYLTRIQCAGNYPPQETGLTFNSWHGKFHLEMHWWHGVHFALWNRTDLLRKSLDYYLSIADKARETARRQGFEGLRWPKMTDPLGNDSPSSVGSFLIWQQPHIIFMAELCYLNSPDKEILRKYADIVFETADFMASYARYDTVDKRYVLGPLLIPAQERLRAESTINPPYELAYWHWGLATAQKWRERLGMELDQEWDKVLNGLSPLAHKDGLYLAAESATDSYTNQRYLGDHPMVLGAYGMIPDCQMVDAVIMKRTFDRVWELWNWDETWGWDFPMTAMAATRLGMPDKAIDALFMDIETNTYLTNGHNYQDQRLRIYLPGNGGLLSAVALMCTGYKEQATDNPGFPKDGTWKVRWENFKRLPE
ncbi:MAG TPA: hypothetical protein ENN61_01155 [Bacteroidaceae bacterium]|nr:hypothetical protein [Bacteroidaceae bacterium]